MNQTVDDTIHTLRARSTSGWWQGVLAGAAALILGLGFLWFLKLVAWPLALLIGAIALAAGLAPLVHRVGRILPRTPAVVVVFLFILLVLAGLIWLAVPPLLSQGQVALQEIPTLVDQTERFLNRWIPGQNNLSLQEMVPPQLISGGSSLLISLPRQFLSLLTALLVVVFGGFYGLIFAPNAHDFLLSLFPPARRRRVDEVLKGLTDAMGGWLRGTAIDMAVVGSMKYIGLTLVGYEIVAPLAVLAGLLAFVPIIGPIIAAIVTTTVGFLQSTTTGLLGLLVSVIVQQTESNFLVPVIMRDQARISPLLTVLALLAGERIGGLVGALVAIPLTAALRVFILMVVAPAIRDWTGAPEVDDEAEEEG